MIEKSPVDDQNGIKIAIPICFYTAFTILLYAKTDYQIFRMCIYVLIFSTIVSIALNTIFLSPTGYMVRCAIGEMLYCITSAILMMLLNAIIGVNAGSIIVIIYCITYLRILNPRFLHRYIFSD